ncbi:MAG: hypothetical protein CV087_23645 [Candidatus Brocadia sp. WS118]|nr:MAG: hypothetical protein CV087_23645 [Candidatus Brocadia sp. WS118]
MYIKAVKIGIGLFCFMLALTNCTHQADVQLSDEQVKEIVKRSYQYVALYNVNNKFAMDNARRTGTNGWNICVPDTNLKDHNMRDIARPNNDTKYLGCMLDLRQDPVILYFPAFDSKYVSLMCTAYDHYVNVPMTTCLGDFRKPEKVLFYSDRTEGYNGEPVEGVDRIYKMSGDFVSAILRVMPHASEPERFKKIVSQMKAVKAITLSEFLGKPAKPYDDPHFPAVGKTDADVFGNNLLEVMQFVFNHLSFDPQNEMDQAVLAAYKPLGIVPGQKYDSTRVAKIDGKQLRRISEKVKAENLALLLDTSLFAKFAPKMLRPKGQTDIEAILAVSVIGPIGLPMEEAMYPNVATTDGKPMNAMNDYVIRMTKEELPPARAFWSLTLYDSKNGFFIPNDRKKYSVGENAGMKLNKDGGIEIYVAAAKPDGVPVENWLPVNRKDEDLDIILRIYVPDLEKVKTWKIPKAEKLK